MGARRQNESLNKLEENSVSSKRQSTDDQKAGTPLTPIHSTNTAVWAAEVPNGPTKAKPLKLEGYQHAEWKRANGQMRKDKFQILPPVQRKTHHIWKSSNSTFTVKEGQGSNSCRDLVCRFEAILPNSLSRKTFLGETFKFSPPSPRSFMKLLNCTGMWTATTAGKFDLLDPSLFADLFPRLDWTP